MKRWIKITAIALIIVISSGLLTGCGEQNSIKKVCVESAEDVLEKTSANVFSQSLTSSAYEIYKDKTTVNYNKEDNSFTCHVYAVISIMALNSSMPSLMYEHFTFIGHMNKSDVVIDYTDANQISQSQLPK